MFLSEEDIFVLQEKLNDFIKEIPKSKTKYYHLNSVSNFIIYLPRFHNRQEQVLVYDNLEEYIKIIKEIGEINQNDSLELFNNFLSPILKYYERNFGFTVYMKLWIYLTTVIAFLIVGSMLKIPMVYYLSCIFLLSIYYSYILMKAKKHKVYAFMW